jgi:hypothetical protein
MWRSDYERINGSDENYVGWGLEDRDLQLRLSRVGIRSKSILGRTAVCHLWHPHHETFVRNNIGTANLDYYQRPGLLTRCLNGLKKRGVDDLRVRVIEGDNGAAKGRKSPRLARTPPDPAPEVEILVMPGEGKFSGKAECKILVLREQCPASVLTCHKPDVIIDLHNDRASSKVPTVPRDVIDDILREAA